MIPLETSLQEVEWIPSAARKSLERLGIGTVGDLLTHYPRRHEDRTRFDRFPQGEMERPICICGLVTKTSLKRFGGFKKMFDATLEEEGAGALSTPVVLRWFNLHYVQKMIVAGQKLIVYGRPRMRGKLLCIEHPEFEIIEEDGELSLNLNRITPVYPATEGLNQRTLRKFIHGLLQEMGDVPDLLPAGLSPLPRHEALGAIHFPETLEQLESARRHLVLTEFFGLQLLVARRRARTISSQGASHGGPGHLLREFLQKLPFPMTGAQRRSMDEIRADLLSTHPMNRLLQGDVGSGKTLVALSAMLLTVEAGFQAALMAPTQILAEQHYLNFCRWLRPLGLRVALRTGARKEETGEPTLFDLGTRDGGNSPLIPPDFPASLPHILIGTHALLYNADEMPHLGLAVIDEQHKFGVLQRARLTARVPAPDVLVMTATPIPRTLTLTAYGDLDVSILDELPPGRGRILTELREDGKLKDLAKFKEHLAAGHQAYVVCPVIDESETKDVKAATKEYEKWREFLAPLTCELLHGRLPAEEKDAIMARFRANETRVLVATTVIEVGIDVPNASVMLIENAEKFGLAQLHQLRGRIGRGSQISYCILLAGSKDPAALDKLRVLAGTTDGFAIAEADLELRGPGDILGTAQSGLPPLKIGNILRDGDLMRQAREAAIGLIANDPELVHAENQRFRVLLVELSDKLLSHIS